MSDDDYGQCTAQDWATAATATLPPMPPEHRATLLLAWADDVRIGAVTLPDGVDPQAAAGLLIVAATGAANSWRLAQHDDD